ncbi:MAG: hypothetical protein Q9214_003651 [Letrouitia sp. 1 TL-2023]
MPRAVEDHKARREEDFEEDYDDETYELSEEEAPAPRSRTARKPRKPAYSDEDPSSEVEEEPRPRKSKKKARTRQESEDEESDDGRGKALVVRTKASKAVAKRASSAKSKKKSRKVEESDDDDDEDDDGEEMMKVERYKTLDIEEVKPEFLNALMDVFERDNRKVLKWVNKGFIRADLMKKEYDIGPVLDKECSKKDREKWDKYVKKTKKSKSKWIFQLMDGDDPYSAGSVSHYIEDRALNRPLPYVESALRDRALNHPEFCDECMEHCHPCRLKCPPWCPARVPPGYSY